MRLPEPPAAELRPPDDSDEGFVAVEVVGPLSRARFPALCVRCGAAADRTLRLTRLFWRTGSDDGGSYVAASLDAPFCRECVRAHGRELRPVPPEVRRRLLRSWAVQSLPFVVPLGVCLWLLAMLGPELLEAAARGGDPLEVGIWGAVCGFFGLMALAFAATIHSRGRMLILEPAGAGREYPVQIHRGPLGSRLFVPAEPTSVAAALDFSDDRSRPFDPERHRFRFRNHEVAARFEELNAHLQWDPASPRARLAGMLRMALVGAAVLAGLYLLLEDLLR
ncbi:MAG TPA: hypothetical protein VGR37_24355 [Longimicrobiaceae bacterium]|nr:hypothetical protein [Longimicrobiaceae bacterium]